MCKVNSIWPVTLVDTCFQGGITRESVINALVMLQMGKTKDGEPHRAKQKVMGFEVEQFLVWLTGVTNPGKAKENVANQNTLTKPTHRSYDFCSYEVFPHF